MRKTIFQMPSTSLGLLCAFSAIFLSLSTAGAVTRTPGISNHSGWALIQKAAYDRTIEQVQRELNRAGYEAGPVDGVLGRRTRDAIRAYQRDKGLPVTGQPNQNLLDHMTSSDAAETQRDQGRAEIAVGRLQRMLDRLGYDVAATGRMDSQTEAAIRSYQRDHSLLVTGQATKSLSRHVGAQAREARGSRGGSAQETIELPPDVIEGFYVTLDDVRARSDKVYDALAGAAGDPISKEDFVGTQLPDKVVPEDTDRELLQRLFTVLDMNGNGRLTRAEWNERIESDLGFADENEDGKITLKELSHARENIGIGDALRLIF